MRMMQFSVFYLIYWVYRHSLANKNINSWLDVVDNVAPGTTADFQHREPASQREMITFMGNELLQSVLNTR